MFDDKSREFLVLTWQMAAAFGQGAGTMLVTRQAAEAVAERYERSLRNVKVTDEAYFRLVAYMRALGAASAAWALREGRAIIDVDDVAHAMQKLIRNQPKPMFECPACMEA